MVAKLAMSKNPAVGGTHIRTSLNGLESTVGPHAPDVEINECSYQFLQPGVYLGSFSNVLPQKEVSLSMKT
jgi:hypothetical protein